MRLEVVDPLTQSTVGVWASVLEVNEIQQVSTIPLELPLSLIWHVILF